MRTVRLLLCLLCMAGLASCGPGDGKVRVEGQFKNLDNAEFYVYSEEGIHPAIDTVRIEGGKFSFDRPCTEAEVLTLLYPNFSRTYIIIEPGATVTIKANAERLEAADVSGTEANERFSAFRLKNLGQPKGDLHLAAAQFIRDNAATIDALAAFVQYFAQREKPEPGETLSLLDVLKKGQPGNKALARIDRRLRPMLQNGPGQPLQSFSAATLDGGQVTRDDFSGKPLLITFLASWQSESHAVAFQQRRLRRAFSGKLQQLTVSLDTDVEKFRQFVASDSVAAPVVCDGQAFDSPLVRQFGVRYVPGNILVGADGRVVARDLKKDQLENEIARLL
ncbi:MAG: AhpC/TSA family protein [Alloprevotella sp.]|nr:AhpC/TSA family protein [Alloprevotella sp.]